MIRNSKTHKILDIEFEIVYSKRRTLGISIRPDSSVIVRVPYLTSLKTINRIVTEKAGWIRKHRESIKGNNKRESAKQYINGESHLFHGKEVILNINKSSRPYIRFTGDKVDIGLDNTNDSEAIRNLLYKGYKNEAKKFFPVIFSELMIKFEAQMFRPTGLIVRSMKKRWGSCSKKGIITLSTELIKLPDEYIEYVIIHELCHLKYHNHGNMYYDLLSKLFPDWKSARKELRNYSSN